MNPRLDLADRHQFLWIAAIFQGGLAGLALLLGWLLGVDPWASLRLEWPSVALGFLTALPLCLLSLVLDRVPFRPFERMRDVWQESLAPTLAECTWWDLVLLAVLVGVSEELLFRGVLEPWLAGWGLAAGILGSNLLFGLVHALTPTYALLAGLIGIYLSLIMRLAEPPNLLIAILCHAGCDLFAFELIRQRHQRQSSSSPRDPLGNQPG
jgi:hypothetical protein